MASTAARGYGSTHQKTRRALLANWQPGDPCTRCGEPMWGPPGSIHLGHTDDRTGYRGLEHASCNTSEGATRGNKQRGKFVLPQVLPKPICKTCGQAYHYGARTCAICGRHYHPTYGQQRSCSRACGTQLRRLAYVPPPMPACLVCGKPCAKRSQKTCSAWCAREASAKKRAQRKTELTCAFCGKTFMGETGRYCSPTCNMLAKYYATRTTQRPTKTVAQAAARRQSRAW